MELALEDVRVTYRRRGVETYAVRGVSFGMRAGETLAIVGESGSGKTTVAKVAAGLQRATSGRVWWRHTTEGSERDNGSTSARVQMVFQHPVQSFDPLWRIRNIVLEPLRHAAASTRDPAALAAEFMERVGLDRSILDRYPRQVSGGQAQRIAIARALISRPDIVILDEPTSGLDQTVRSRTLALLADLQDQTGVGYLMVTHDISSVKRLATRIIVMHRGRIVESGVTSAIIDGARHPYTRSLIAAVPVPDPRVRWSGIDASPAGDAWLADGPCPVHESACGEHNSGMHEIAQGHAVACTAQ